jgi:hypothetical protein
MKSSSMKDWVLWVDLSDKICIVEDQYHGAEYYRKQFDRFGFTLIGFVAAKTKKDAIWYAEAVLYPAVMKGKKK